MNITKRTIAITDEDVDQALDRMREERAYLVNAPERGAENDDVLFAEVQVYIDGEPRAPEPAKLLGFVLGPLVVVVILVLALQLIAQGLGAARRVTR
jgi:FKBP-type peptidyl-prolyl cis-trans isomerase (trigger factor)